MKILDIFDFCERNVEGYIFSEDVSCFLDSTTGKKQNAVFFTKNGVQITASVEKKGIICMIHLSFSPLLSINKDFESLDVFQSYILENGGQIVKDLFGKLVFVRAPEDKNNPQVMHFFSIIDD